jgi:hypothetical protein
MEWCNNEHIQKVTTRLHSMALLDSIIVQYCCCKYFGALTKNEVT